MMNEESILLIYMPPNSQLLSLFKDSFYARHASAAEKRVTANNHPPQNEVIFRQPCAFNAHHSLANRENEAC